MNDRPKLQLVPDTGGPNAAIAALRHDLRDVRRELATVRDIQERDGMMRERFLSALPASYREQLIGAGINAAHRMTDIQFGTLLAKLDAVLERATATAVAVRGFPTAQR